MELKKLMTTISWLVKAGRIENALDKCEEVLNIDKFYTPALWSRCFLKLLSGDRTYWADYEWHSNPCYSFEKGWFKRTLKKPLWEGQKLYKNERVFLYCDEGYGDYFQFLRYVKLIQEQGATTIVEAMPNTSRITSTCDGIDQIVHPNPNQNFEYEFHCPLMLAPVYFDIANYVHSGIPYLFPPKNIGNHLKDFIKMNRVIPTVGLSWKGNPKHSMDSDRSIDPCVMKSIKTSKSIISLQHKVLEDGFTNIGMMINDWGDTAQIIESLDLVITVDTAIAHLAGAMGKEVWILLPQVPDWRRGSAHQTHLTTASSR